MQYLTAISRTDAVHGGRIQERALNANPILESFGNAQTVRNRNSSRFGKYNELCFNPVGCLEGSKIKTYLLESSRVVFQQEHEQNYHVFYEILAGLDEDTLDRLRLDRSHTYSLLYPGQATPPSENSQEFREHQENFEKLHLALGIVGLDEHAE